MGLVVAVDAGPRVASGMTISGGDRARRLTGGLVGQGVVDGTGPANVRGPVV